MKMLKQAMTCTNFKNSQQRHRRYEGEANGNYRMEECTN